MLLAILAVLLVAIVGMSLLTLHFVRMGEKKMGCMWTEVELPEWVTPMDYRVHLDVEWDSPYLVRGNSEVDIAVHETTSCVVIHAKGMNVSFVSIPEEQAGKAFILQTDFSDELKGIAQESVEMTCIQLVMEETCAG